ncbi:carbamoylphosphate synthase large subunit [Halobacteroides halobius DSM 5150]|uniref:Carbamoylphosphate synthase large subunit n=1 Tax=Halobacteroides halobius (strain ATCC 35273 / DSM 5150 / MD-1) TaxID=748449 RepID=L0K9Z2_HALHC|nr:ATP-grasp domain-containing protein [Halobacteroides halobius]AGB42132.1 carbamoylphosphate synthase large subunit [Halobacteroides halobius DSM 5150]
MKKKVLVFPCGSEIGLEINRALAKSIHVELLGASSVKSNHGKYVYKNYIEGLPFVNEPTFIDELNLIIKSYDIDFIFPAHDSVVLKLAEFKNKLKCEVIGSPVQTCRICRSKNKTYDVFKSKINTPYIYKNLDSDFQFPVFLKPDIGQGSKGVHKAFSKKNVRFYLEKNSSLIMMEYLPGKEYTIDCFTNKYGELIFCKGRERERIYNGISAHTFPVNDENFKRMARVINNTLEFRGAWFFQVKKRKNGELVLMEIAPRIAGSMGLYRNLGVNFPLLSIFDRLNFDLEIVYNKFGMEMDRALVNRFKSDLEFDNVYIDLDDTIIIDDKVNPLIIGFIYQCLNKGIKVHLITRHSEDNVLDYLKEYNIENLFETISILNKSENKSDYIKQNNSIFIDDSFSERLEVFNKLSLPTFDITAIESLIDWRV